MRLLLQQRPDGREAPRFVQLMLEPDLLGGWTLVRETGQIGGRSTLRRVLPLLVAAWLLLGEVPHSVAQTSKALKLTPHRIRALEEEALRRLRHLPEAQGLREAA